MTTLERIGLEILGGMLAIGAVLLWWNLHNRTEQKLGAAACIQTTTIDHTEAKKDVATDQAAAAVDVNAVVQGYETKVLSLSRANDDLSRRLLASGSICPGGMPNPRGTPGAKPTDAGLSGGQSEAAEGSPAGLRADLDAVLAACERLPDIGVTNRRTAISTVGWVPGIERIAEYEKPIALALSLHAPNDALRSQLMPVNDRFPLAEVLAACDRYRAKRRRKVFVEYVMLEGVNDLPEHARELAALLDPRIYKINLIPYNPTGAYDGSSPERIEQFRAILHEHRVPATVRLTRGRDIDAACGQLAAKAAA